MAKLPLPDTEINYCRLCFHWHRTGEHRAFIRLPCKIVIAMAKIYWYSIGAVGVVCGWVVLIGLSIGFIVILYAIMANLLGFQL